MYRILIVEDSIGIAEEIKKQGEMWNYSVEIVKDLRNVTAEFAQFSPHLVLMDINLPYYNGYYWCTEIRKISKVPIIFLSSASDNMNIVMAMNMGGDDFVTKPFSMEVLMAKIQAVLRRTYDFGESQPVIEHNGAILDLGDGTLSVKGVDEKISLTKNEFRLMKTLLENRGRIVSREMLMEKLWETDSFIDDNTLTVNINRLRKKLASAGLADYIETKFGQGYIIGG